jgi:hypothetical protein
MQLVSLSSVIIASYPNRPLCYDYTIFYRRYR